MKAFIEITSGIIRAGSNTEKYGDPFDGMVPFSCVDGKTAVIKGLITGDKRLTIAYARAAFRALKEYGLTPKWERIK